MANMRIDYLSHKNRIYMSKELRLTMSVETYPCGRSAISLRFRGDLPNVDYAAADRRLEAEMARLGLGCDMSDYVCIYPSAPSAYAGGSGCDDAIADICVTLPDGSAYEPSGDFRLVMVPGGKFLVFTMTGPYSQIPQAYGEMYFRLLPEAYKTYEPDPRRPMMESYANDPGKVSPEELITKFWYPIM